MPELSALALFAVVHVTAAAIGVSAILASSAVAFSVGEYAGAAPAPAGDGRR